MVGWIDIVVAWMDRHIAHKFLSAASGRVGQSYPAAGAGTKRLIQKVFHSTLVLLTLSHSLTCYL